MSHCAKHPLCSAQSSLPPYQPQPLTSPYFSLSRMSYSWNHTICRLLKLDSLCILDNYPLSNVSLQIFSLVCDLSYNSFYGVFCREDFNFNAVYLSGITSLVLCPKSCYQTQGNLDFLLCCPLKVLWFCLWHLGLLSILSNFCEDMISVSRFNIFLLYVNVQLFQYPLLIRLSSLCCIAFAVLLKIPCCSYVSIFLFY
jgi:hypothetical protein